MSEESAKSLCFECKRPLVEIDNRGQRLRGCMTCNKWWSLTEREAVKLSVEDLSALQKLGRTKCGMRLPERSPLLAKKEKPRRGGCEPGLLCLCVQCVKRGSPREDRITTSPPRCVLGVTVQCKILEHAILYPG